MKSRTVWGLLAAFLVSFAAIAGIAYAYRGNPGVKGPNYDAEVHGQLEAAIDAGDYDKWLEIRNANGLPMYGKMFQSVNKDNFGRYADLHKANLAGDTAKVEAIRAELGLGTGMMRRGSGRMDGSGTGLKKGFVDANNDGLCDAHGCARE